jgi:hypothetical protein
MKSQCAFILALSAYMVGTLRKAMTKNIQPTSLEGMLKSFFLQKLVSQRLLIQIIKILRKSEKTRWNNAKLDKI